jgi:DNA helicase-2/ATP-dependent DNA helicase PcrA
LKTRVIVERVRWLLERGIVPRGILLLTFTNNAAKEMLERIENPEILACTFHSLSYRILTEFLPSDKKPFTVIDDDDQEKLVRSIVKELGLGVSPKIVLEYINYAKSKGSAPTSSTSEEEQVYREYERVRISRREYDFGALQMDALLYANKCNGRWKHILIDEYQDTDPVQWELTKILEEGSESITVVCDDQQSIYGWRGADINNILRYPEYYDAPVITLRYNYRSTKDIVRAINNVVESASEKLCNKDLVAIRESGIPIKVLTFSSDIQEAGGIADMIRERGSPGNHMILYRANWMSRIVEEALTVRRIPYRVIDSTGFYKRREIRDLMAYLRLLYNPLDESAALRIINTPPRGIGKILIEKMVGNYGSICKAIEISNNKNLRLFGDSLNYIRSNSKTAFEILQKIIKLTNYMNYLSDDDRVENVNRLLEGAISFGGSLDEYMMMVMLLSDDNETTVGGSVRLMTMHSAKGTEAKHVYVVGVEEGIIPHPLSWSVEEERRLFYVAISRAMDELVVSNTVRRWRFTEYTSSVPSRFIREIT